MVYLHRPTSKISKTRVHAEVWLIHLLCLGIAQCPMAENSFTGALEAGYSKRMLHSWYQFVICSLIANHK